MSSDLSAPVAGVRELWREPDFVRYWWARVASSAGSQMVMVGLGWQMYELTGQAWDLGLVGLFQFLPALLLTLPAGQVADRFKRNHVVALCLALQVGVALLLAWGSAVAGLQREGLFALSVLIGVARAFQMPAQQALTPSLVPARLLARAMAFSSGGMQMATILGPALAGLLFAAGAPVVYGCAWVLFVVAMVCMLRVHLRYQQPMAREPVSLAHALAGVRFIFSQPELLGALSLDLFAVLLGGAVALLPMYARDILHTGPWGLGCLRCAPAVGALSMSLCLTRWPLSHRVGALMLGSVGVYGLATVVFGFSRSLPLSLLMLAISGAADMVSVVIRQTLVQVQTPEAMRGRVSAVNSVFIGASNQLGEFESGATAAWWGPVGAVVVGGVGTLVVALAWFKLFPALAQRDTLAA